MIASSFASILSSDAASRVTNVEPTTGPALFDEFVQSVHVLEGL